MRGFDFMDVINGWGAPHAGHVLRWGRTGGIVALCWHWRLGGKDFCNTGYDNNDGRGYNWPSGDPTTNATNNDDLRKLGDELQKFADARIPVLWRPLHEAPGNEYVDIIAVDGYAFVRLDVVDAQGKSIRSEVVGGRRSLSFDGLRSGVLILRLHGFDGSVTSRRLVVP